MTNSIKSLEWVQNNKGDLTASAGNGLLTVHFQPRDEVDVWQVTFTPFPQFLGEHASLQDALKAADDFIGDS